MEGLVWVIVLGTHFSLLSTIEALLARSRVHHYTHGSYHIASFAISSISQVLLAIGGSITINMLNFVVYFGSFSVSLYQKNMLASYKSDLLISSGATVRSKSKLHQPGAAFFLALNTIQMIRMFAKLEK